MPLAKPKITPQLDEYEIEEVPDGIPRDQWKRPLITPPGGGPPTGYTRASTLGKAVEDTFHLNQWTVRAVVLGMSRREELVARAAAIATNEGDDRKPLQEIGDEAKTAGGGDKGANIGTALHKLAERADAGDDLSYLPSVLADAIQAYLKCMADFEVLASETFVVCDQLQAAGSFDRVVRSKVDLQFKHAELGEVTIPAGAVFVLDLKTGKQESAKYWGPTYGVQQTVYACGQPYWPGRGADGRYTWEELCGAVPSDRWALILHVPGDTPADAGLMMVDLEDGRVMSDLALDNRKARKSKTLLTDAFPVKDVIETAEDMEIEPPQQSAEDFELTPEQAEEMKDWCPECDTSPGECAPGTCPGRGGPEITDLFGLIAVVEHEAQLEGLWSGHQDAWTDEHTAAAKTRLAQLAQYQAGLEAEVQNMAPDSATPIEQPAQVKKLGLIASLRYAKTEAVLEKIWEQNQDIWCEDASRMARIRSAELAGEQVSA